MVEVTWVSHWSSLVKCHPVFGPERPGSDVNTLGYHFALVNNHVLTPHIVQEMPREAGSLQIVTSKEGAIMLGSHRLKDARLGKQGGR